MRKDISLAFALLLGAASMGAHAVEGNSGFISGELGYGDTEIDIDDFGSETDGDRSGAVRGGWYFTPNFAIEGVYANLYNRSGGGAEIDFDGWGAGLVGRVNFGQGGEGFYILGRAGVFSSKAEARVDDLGSASDSSTNPYYGVGAGWDFNHDLGIGLNYTFYDADLDGVSIETQALTATVEFRF